ncbi:SAM-dependent methyltransferase [Pseudonocardia acidicola]|uniref:SAM-dependent MidA family methyltransferase n=1 Tax=Pseudonocardia acidicola TaxID=2724939 RepID=A0ABX1S7C3_9PSEU|nr:SAM-dependent methyltransferase [Pseudonocardia acidicola]NMH97464.1 hypothetical protein [Pseudonocardia acidicola]
MWTGWRAATDRALYAERGFYRRSAPCRHFRTSVHASARFAAALSTLLQGVDAALGHPAVLDVVDVGAGRAELLLGLRAAAPAELRSRLRLTAVERAARPDGLAPEIGWRSCPPDVITGVVIANEWLDNIPVDVVVRTADGDRLLLVDPVTGDERRGPAPTAADAAWLRRWWPLTEPGDRAEVGRPRDEAWADVVRRLHRGLAVAADYAHDRSARPPFGTLAGYRGGRAVVPVPDGSCDITAHVALDACAAAGARAGAHDTLLTTQRAALRALGLRGARPPHQLAHSAPTHYLRELQRAGEEAELMDPCGLGRFGWLVQTIDMDASAAFPVPPAR